MQERILSDWIQTYLEYTEDQESPEKYHFWTACGLIAASLKRNVWMQRVKYIIHPNLFIIFVADSGVARKSTAIDLGMELIEDTESGIYVMQDRMTPEGLVKHFNRGRILYGNPSGNNTKGPEIHTDSHVLIYADELANLFGYDKITASRMAILLTRIYKAPKHYDHTTAREDRVRIYNPYPTLLAATDPTNLKVLPEDAIGGLLGRILFIVGRDKRKSIAWDTDDDTQKIKNNLLKERLIHDFNIISKLSGEIIPSKEAKNTFEEWYESLQNVKVVDRKLAPFFQRCHDTALKVAMILSISRSNDLTVNKAHVMAGIDIINRQLPEATRVVNLTGTSDYENNRTKLLEGLRRAGGMLPRKIAIKIVGIIVDEFDKLIATMVQEELIETRTLKNIDIIRLRKDDPSEAKQPNSS